MSWKTIDDLALAGKTVLTRVDINVPMDGDVVTDTTRIDKIRPTVEDIIARGDGANGEVTEPDVMTKVTVQE